MRFGVGLHGSIRQTYAGVIAVNVPGSLDECVRIAESTSATRQYLGVHGDTSHKSYPACSFIQPRQLHNASSVALHHARRVTARPRTDTGKHPHHKHSHRVFRTHAFHPAPSAATPRIHQPPSFHTETIFAPLHHSPSSRSLTVPAVIGCVMRSAKLVNFTLTHW